MTPKNSIRLDPGKMYFSTPEGLKPLGEVQEVEITEEHPELDIEGRTPLRIVQEPAEFTASITLTDESAEALRNLTATAEAAWRVFKQTMELVKKMCDVYPHRRSKYLAAHHGDPLVRKKNVKRITRYYKKLTKGGADR